MRRIVLLLVSLAFLLASMAYIACEEQGGSDNGSTAPQGQDVWQGNYEAIKSYSCSTLLTAMRYCDTEPYEFMSSDMLAWCVDWRWLLESEFESECLGP
jgi:hypothetical protein